MKMIYNSTSRMTQNAPGVSIRVQGFGTTDSVEFVDPAKVIGTSYFEPIVKRLIDLGYERDKNIFGAPYDFRRAPNELKEYFNDLTSLIELAFERNGGQRVILICHSMGCLNSLYFLNTKTQRWKDEYIKSVISLSGVWGGSVKAMKAFASGDNFGVVVIPSLSLRKDIRTFPSLAYLLPSQEIWPHDTVLMKHHNQTYTVKDYKQFFEDIKYPLGYEMWLDVRNLTSPTVAPGVEVHCLHGFKVTTIEGLEYPLGNFPDGSRPKISYGDGDGTVNLISLQACNNWKTKQRQPIYYKNFTSIDHMTILSDERILEYIGEAIAKQ